MTAKVAPELREDYIREFLYSTIEIVPTDGDVRSILGYMEDNDLFEALEYAIIDVLIMQLYGFLDWKRKKARESNEQLEQIKAQHRARVRAGDGLDTEFRIG